MPRLILNVVRLGDRFELVGGVARKKVHWTSRKGSDRAVFARGLPVCQKLHKHALAAGHLWRKLTGCLRPVSGKRQRSMLYRKCPCC